MSKCSASEDLEEGEIEGEEQVPFTTQPPAAPQARQHTEYIVAPSHTGRAPRFYTPMDNNNKSPAAAPQQTYTSGIKPKKLKKKLNGPAVQLKWRPGDAPIRLSDVQDLVLSVVTAHPNPRWCSIKNGDKVSKVVLIAAHGLTTQLLKDLPDLSKSLGDLFGAPITMQARNSVLVPAQTAHALLTLPVKRKRPRSDTEDATTTNRDQPEPETEAGEYGGSNGIDEERELLNGATPSASPARKRMKLAGDEDVAGRHTAHLTGNNKTAGNIREHNTSRTSTAAEDGNSSRPQLEKLSTTPAAAVADLPPASSYVLSLDQLEENEYPLPQYTDTGELSCPPAFVATQSLQGGKSPQHAMVAVDCEMCITEQGFELTRATVIDCEGAVLMDELVVPHNPILNYNTQYSGISAAMLEGVTTRIEDIQKKFLELVSAETLLIAHSGENDLRALKIIHANVIDTSVMFPHPKGPPAKSALRVLASRFLRRTIQRDEHNPIEDARAAMDLALLKFSKGPAFGSNQPQRGEKLTDAASAAGKRSTVIDDALNLPRYTGGNSSAIAVVSDEEGLEKAIKELRKEAVEFLWLQLSGLHRTFEKQVAKLDVENTAIASMAEAVQQQDYSSAVFELVAHLRQLYTAAPAGTLFVVTTGQGNTPFQSLLENQKYHRQQVDSEYRWSMQDEELLQDFAIKALSALCFVSVKGSGPATE